MIRCFLLFALTAVVGCGIGSVSPVISDTEALTDPRLIGTWRSGKESAVISASGTSRYDILYTEEDGKTGRFHGRLGRLGSFRVLDIQPVEPLPAASDTYKSLLLRAHGLVIIDSIDESIQFRLPKADSLKAYLKRRPQAVSHSVVGDNVLLTAPSRSVNRFFTAYLRRRGVLDELNVWRRAVP